MFKNIIAPLGWFYNDTINQWQKTNKELVVCVSKLLNGYQVQLYVRGQLSFSEMEARINGNEFSNCNKIFQLGNEWLEKYSQENFNNNFFELPFIFDPNIKWLE